MKQLLAICSLVVFAIFPGALPCLQAQSIAQSSDHLQTSLQNSISKLTMLLDSLPDNPGMLSDGSFASSITDLLASDKKLLNESSNQIQNLQSKKQGITANTMLSEADKTQLSGAIDDQLGPMNAMQGKIAEFDGNLDKLKNTLLPQWDATYRQFADIEGSDAAKDKLRKVITSFKETLVDNDTPNQRSPVAHRKKNVSQ
jgi:hypothetical protein